MQHKQWLGVWQDKVRVRQSALRVFAIFVMLGLATSASVMAKSVVNKVEATRDTGHRQSPPSDTDGTTSLFLPLIRGGATAVSDSEEKPPPLLLARQQSANHTGKSDVDPPVADNHTFVTDTGMWLDQYLGRADLPNGVLTLNIGVDAPVVKPEEVGPEGFLLMTPFLLLVDNKTLPTWAHLTLEVWDIDDEETLACSQIDYVSINGWQVENP